jgi:hypothetical protein
MPPIATRPQFTAYAFFLESQRLLLRVSWQSLVRRPEAAEQFGDLRRVCPLCETQLRQRSVGTASAYIRNDL